MPNFTIWWHRGNAERDQKQAILFAKRKKKKKPPPKPKKRKGKRKGKKQFPSRLRR